MGQKAYYKNEQEFRCAYYKKDNSWNILWGDEFNDGTGIESFKEGFTFYEAGGTESIYNDIRDPVIVNINGNSLFITSNVLIKESTYTLGVTGEYKRILSHPAIWLDLIK